MASICRPICRSIIEPVARADGGVRVIGGSGPTPDLALAALKAAAVSLWTLDEPTGDFIDLIGSNDLAITGPVSRGSGKVGAAVGGDSSSNRVVSVNADELSPSNTSFFVSAWVRLDNPTAHQGLFGSIRNTFSDGWALRTNPAGNGDIQVVYIRADSVGSQPTIGNGSDGEWHLCVFGYEHAGKKVWWSFDGGAIVDQDRNEGVGASMTAFSLFGASFVGPVGVSLDEIGFYAGDRPTSQMIAALYNGGAGISNSTIAAA